MRPCGYRRGTSVVINQPPVVRFCGRYGHADDARVKVEVMSPQPGQLTKAQVRERRQEQQCPVPGRNLIEQPDQGADRHDGAFL
jgi:hypothetical protein